MIRQMTLMDLPQIIALEQKHQLHPWPKEAFLQALRLKQHCPVYEEDHPHDPEAIKITAYGVADGGHGRTICAESIEGADAIYQAWFDYGATKKVDSFYAEIEPENRAARIRLKRFGFKKIGELPHFYGVGKHAERWSRPANTADLNVTQQNEANQGVEPNAESA